MKKVMTHVTPLRDADGDNTKALLGIDVKHGETINHRQTHSNTIHRIDHFGPQLLSHYYIKMHNPKTH